MYTNYNRRWRSQSRTRPFRTQDGQRVGGQGPPVPSGSFPPLPPGALIPKGTLPAYRCLCVQFQSFPAPLLPPALMWHHFWGGFMQAPPDGTYCGVLILTPCPRASLGLVRHRAQTPMDKSPQLGDRRVLILSPGTEHSNDQFHLCPSVHVPPCPCFAPLSLSPAPWDHFHSQRPAHKHLPGSALGRTQAKAAPQNSHRNKPIHLA